MTILNETEMADEQGAGPDAVAREYLEKLLDRHRLGASENDIRSAFRDFLVRTGIASDENEIVTETRPASDSRNKVDLYIRNTYVEFKRSLIKSGVIDPEAIAQLDGYILENAKAGNGIQNGILTDGQNYLKRSVGDDILPIVTESRHEVFDRPDQGNRLYEYLGRIVDTQAENITPDAVMLTKYFGLESDVFKTATALLTDSHRNNRDQPTVAVKRKLWRELLQVAIGQNSVDDAEENDWLFVRHTYLTALVGIIVQAHFGIDIPHYANTEPGNLLSGEILRQQTGLKGITESDLFAWPLEAGEYSYLGVIARQVEKFNWEQNADGLAATLYQNTISQEERKRMGEYYTPRWLAKAITEEMITDPANTRVLDPACGSGTFIEAAIRHIIAHTAELSPGERLAKLQENIAGIDLHPVAVQLAKATWVIASHETITEARQAGMAADVITAPIHLGDSMQLRYENSELDAQGYITLDTGETLEGHTGEVRFQVPLSLARDAERFDNMMMEISRAIERDDDAARVLDDFGITGSAERPTMEATIANMRALRDADRNHVWAYYLRNMTRPMVIAEEKVDAIIGNPPWLTYDQSANIIREELKSLSQTRYQIWAGGNNAPHQDVATLFYCRIAELYLREQGLIGMVLPHSALRTGHHLKWRNAYYETKRPVRSREAKQAMSFDFSVKRPWDLDNLEPNDFFPIASCVVFARLPGYRGDFQLHQREAKPLALGQVEIWSGPTDTPQVKRRLSHLIQNDGTFRSPYAGLSNQGPTITDRRLFFVTHTPNKNKLALPDTSVTYPRIGTLDKKKYSVRDLNGQVVSNDNLLSVYLGECLAPYVALPPLTAALPVSKASLTMPLDEETGEIDRQGLDENLRARWEKMERLWEANRGKTDTKSLMQNLNWLNKLARQLEYLRDPGDRPVRIAYTQSGRPTAALIVDSKAILDRNLYQVTCRNLDEAHYLLAIINSNALAKAAKPFCASNWAKEIRHLEKHLWRLPIPRYDADDERHTELSRLGQVAAQETSQRVQELTERHGTEWVTSDRVRRDLRSGWQTTSATAIAIETAVGELLGTG